CYISSFHCSGDLRLPHSFPTRRSSDLKRIWVPLGTKDFASFIPQLLSEDVDAIYLGLGGADAVNFLNQYQQAGGNAHLIGGSLIVDQTLLSSKGKAKESPIRTPAANGLACN